MAVHQIVCGGCRVAAGTAAAVHGSHGQDPRPLTGAQLRRQTLVTVAAADFHQAAERAQHRMPMVWSVVVVRHSVSPGLAAPVPAQMNRLCLMLHDIDQADVGVHNLNRAL